MVEVRFNDNTSLIQSYWAYWLWWLFPMRTWHASLIYHKDWKLVCRPLLWLCVKCIGKNWSQHCFSIDFLIKYRAPSFVNEAILDVSTSDQESRSTAFCRSISIDFERVVSKYTTFSLFRIMAFYLQVLFISAFVASVYSQGKLIMHHIEFWTSDPWLGLFMKCRGSMSWSKNGK